MLTKLVGARSLAFKAHMSNGRDNLSEEQLPIFTDQTLVVAARRPNLLRVQDVTVIPSSVSVYMKSAFDLYLCDGLLECDISTPTRTQICRPAASSLHELRGSRGLVGPIAPHIVFASNPLDGFTLARVEKHQGYDAHVFVKKVNLEDQKIEQMALVRADTLLPCLYSEARIESNGESTELWRVEYSEWFINPEIPNEVFISGLSQGTLPE